MPLTLSLGVWTAGVGPSYTATLRIDPRLFAWIVNKAARRQDLKYQVKEGNPAVQVTLT
jgi:hypothetical protein